MVLKTLGNQPRRESSASSSPASAPTSSDAPAIHAKTLAPPPDWAPSPSGPPPDALRTLSDALRFEEAARALLPRDYADRIAGRLQRNAAAAESGGRHCVWEPGRSPVWVESEGGESQSERRAELEARLRRQLTAAGIPADFADASFDTTERGWEVETQEANARALSLCRRLATEWVPGHKGLTLAGPFGCGKTFLCRVALRLIIGHKTTDCRAVTVPDLLQMYRDSYGKAADDYGALSSAQIFDRYAGCAVLLLDDLGAERASPGDGGEWAREQIFRVVNHRHEAKLTTLVTTNLSREQVEQEKHGGRIASRLLARSPYILMDGPDYRQIQDAADPFAD